MEKSDQNRDGSGDTGLKTFLCPTGNKEAAGISSAGAADQTDPQHKTTAPSTPSVSGAACGENWPPSVAEVLTDSAADVIQTSNTPPPSNVLEPVPSSVLEPGPSNVLEPVPSSVLEPGPSNVLEPVPSSVLEPGPSSVLEPGPSSVLEPGPSNVLEPGPSQVRSPSRLENVTKPPEIDITPITSTFSPQNRESFQIESGEEGVKASIENLHGSTSQLLPPEQSDNGIKSVNENESLVSNSMVLFPQDPIPSNSKATEVDDNVNKPSIKDTSDVDETARSLMGTNTETKSLAKDSIKQHFPDTSVISFGNISTIEADKHCAKSFNIDSNNEDCSDVKKRRVEEPVQPDKSEPVNWKIQPVTEEEMETEFSLSEENRNVSSTPTARDQHSFAGFSEGNRNNDSLTEKSIGARISFESSNARFGDEGNDDIIGEESCAAIIETGTEANRIYDDSCDARLGFETNDTKYDEDSNIDGANKITRIGEETFGAFIAEESNMSRLGEESNDIRVGEETFVGFIAEESNMSRLGEESNMSRLGEESNMSRLGEESNTSRIGEESNMSRLGEESNMSELGEESNISRIGDESLDASRIGGETIDALIVEESNISRIGEESNAALVVEGRMDISITAASNISGYDVSQTHGAFPAANLFEYQWPPETGAEWYMLQEQISEYLSVKSFKRKYPDLHRRPVDMNEKTFLHDRGVVSETQCDLGLTALKSEEVLDLMIKDYPMQYREYAAVLQEKERQTISDKHKEYDVPKFEKSKLADYMKKAVRSAAEFNVQFQRERREERKAYFDLQTMAIHYPTYKHRVLPPECTKVGSYPVAVIPGQFQDYYKNYTQQELRYFPVGTAVYGPPKKFKDILAEPWTGETSDDSDEDSAEDQDGSDSNSDDGESSDAESIGVAPLPATTPGTDTAPDTPTANNKQKTTEPVAEIQEEQKKDKKEEKEVEKICRICKTGDDLLKGKIEDLVQCSECKTSGHPVCLELTTQMIPVIRTYPWQCMECKTCVECMDPYDEDKMMFCDRCDRGYHTFCVGVKSIPTGRWECPSCKDMPTKPLKKSRRQTRQNGVPSPKPTITS